MNKQIFTVALLAGSLVSFGNLPAQDNRKSNTRQPTLEDRIDQLEQDEQGLKGQVDQLRNDVADLQDRVKRLEGGQQAPQGPAPPPQTSGPSHRTKERTQSSGEEQSYDVFYQGLQSGGHWFDDPTYGEVWQPDIANSDSNWRPYNDGHWAYTDRGWTWISNEDFGWATYHYGRWARRSDTGWVWIPGSRWAPAWVSWRESSDHVGWAPLPPEVADDSQVRIEGWVDNYYDIGPAAYLFVKIGDLSRPSYRDVVLPPANNVELFTKTRNVTDIVYGNDVVAVNGPRYEEITSQAKIPSYKLNYVTGNDGRFGINTRGDQLEVMAPAPKLQTSATVQPKVEKTLGKAQVDRGWQEIDKQKEAQLKQAIQQQAPIPANLPPKPAAPRPASAEPQNRPAQTSRQQPSSNNPPAPEVSPQGQRGSTRQQATAGGQPPRPESTPAEAGRPGSSAPGQARQTGRSTSGEANAPREETRQPGKPSPTPQRAFERQEQRQEVVSPTPSSAANPQRAIQQREQKQQSAKPAQPPSEESKNRAPATEQAPRREQPAAEKRNEATSRSESQREEPARKEEPTKKEEPLGPRERPETERRAEEKQPERQNSGSNRSEKPKQEKSKKEEPPPQ
jgi:uncharacterized protein DUF6600